MSLAAKYVDIVIIMGAFITQIMYLLNAWIRSTGLQLNFAQLNSLSLLKNKEKHIEPVKA